MIVRGASIPGDEPPGQDRWTATSHGVIVLDGASAFSPATPTAGAYVDALLPALARALEGPADLRTALAHVISEVQLSIPTAEQGAGPSATVLILHEVEESLDLLVLGDSTAVIGLHEGHTERWTDRRITSVAPDIRSQYRTALRAGSGYNSAHQDRLRAIQRAEHRARNTPNGYWIAEASPVAAHHALVRRYRSADIAWCVLATDGAQRGLDHHHVEWADLHKASTVDLQVCLADLHRWETYVDPDGRQLPRAKRHDDKTLVVWVPDQS